MPLIALVDCNNFYASCERVFSPSLENKPIVILSNNDGCIIARSNQAKALGIPMGAPIYKYKTFCEKHNVNIFSSNYALYGDLSQRVMKVLKYFCPEIEVYSIDEAFLFLDSLDHLDLINYLSMIRHKIKMWVGLPVSIGLAPSKTLAKLANLIAKKQTITGVCDLRCASTRDIHLSGIPVSDIWGIGRNLTVKLNNLKIYTAKQLCDSDPKHMRKFFGVTLERTILELRGISCIGIEELKPKNSIISSRSFGKKITDLAELEEAVSNYVARACEKLRQQKSSASQIQVFIKTSPFQPDFYQNEIMLNLPSPSSDSFLLIKMAKSGLKKIYKSGLKYQKAGVVLLGIVLDGSIQQDIFIDSTTLCRHKKIMDLVDRLGSVNSKDLYIAAQGTQRNWQMRKSMKSPSYTTDWKQLVTAFAKD